MGLYLRVECMNLIETNFSRTAESQRLWQGAICHVWTSQFNKHWRQSQKQLQKYDIRDSKEFLKNLRFFQNSLVFPDFKLSLLKKLKSRQKIS